jgi:hypothetical protein
VSKARLHELIGQTPPASLAALGAALALYLDV